MKKSLIALAALAATGAFAQSSVTLYGVVDGNYGVRTTETKAEGAASAVKSKVTGMTDGGPNGLSASRWGMRGSEDLGGGMKANFTLESAISSDTGASAGFARRSIVGVEGGFGRVDLGREYTPAFWTLLFTDATGLDGYGTTSLGQGLSAAQMTALGRTAADAAAIAAYNPVATPDAAGGANSRRSSSITYTSPNMSGLTFKLQLGENKTQDTTAAGVTTTTKNSGLGLNVAYTSGPLFVGAAYDQQKGGANVPKATTAVVGGTYDLGAAKVYANYAQHKSESTTTAGAFVGFSAKGKQYNLGVTVPMGAVTLVAGVGRNELQYGDGVKGTGTDFVLGADYSLSKRTTAYIRTGKKDAISEGGNSVKTTGVHVGMRHTF